ANIKGARTHLQNRHKALRPRKERDVAIDHQHVIGGRPSRDLGSFGCGQARGDETVATARAWSRAAELPKFLLFRIRALPGLPCSVSACNWTVLSVDPLFPTDIQRRAPTRLITQAALRNSSAASAVRRLAVRSH